MTGRVLRRFLLAAALAMSAAVAFAQATYPLDQVTIDNTAGGIGLTSTKYAPTGRPPASKGLCRLRTAEISYTFDRSTTVTTTVGVLLEIGDQLPLTTPEMIANFRGIRTGSTSGQLDCHYWR